MTILLVCLSVQKDVCNVYPIEKTTIQKPIGIKLATTINKVINDGAVKLYNETDNPTAIKPAQNLES